MVKTMLLPLGRDDFLAPSLVRLLLVADFIGTSLGSLHQDGGAGLFLSASLMQKLFRL
jgi:hypothetical protein